MERLTIIDGCGNDELARCMNCGLEKAGSNLENCGMCEEGWQRALRRLSAYEDNGLTPEEIKEFAEDVAYQFGYYFPIKDMLYISTGGLSTLERAFDILGWNDPHPVPECECEVPGCHERANCGTPTKDGYKRVCGKHFAELPREEAEAVLAGKGGQDHA